MSTKFLNAFLLFSAQARTLEWRAKYMRERRQKKPDFALHVRDREELEAMRQLLEAWRRKNGKRPGRPRPVDASPEEEQS